MPFIDVRGKSLYYRLASAQSQRDDAGAVLLFIHGLGSSSSFYGPIIPSLTAAGYPCVAFDTHGSTLSKFNGEYGGIEGIVEDTAELISQLNLIPGRIILVGHSMGAIVASALALRIQPLGVVLIGPVHPNPGLKDVFGARIASVEKHGMEAMADTIPVAATGPRSTATHQAFIRALLLGQTPGGYISLCRAIAEASAPAYGEIQSPLLVITGSHDKTSPLESAETILKSWGPGVKTQLEVLDGVGHWHCIEAAEQVETLIEVFAAKLKQDTTR